MAAKAHTATDCMLICIPLYKGICSISQMKFNTKAIIVMMNTSSLNLDLLVSFLIELNNLSLQVLMQ